MTTPTAYKYLTALSDNDLLAEWDRVTDLDPPDYSLEAAIDHETFRRMGEPETSGIQLLGRKLHEEAKAAHNRELIDRIKALEAAMKEVDDALYWMLNLVHGNSKGGPDFSPPSDAEWIEAVETAQSAHDAAKATLGGDA